MSGPTEWIHVLYKTYLYVIFRICNISEIHPEYFLCNMEELSFGLGFKQIARFRICIFFRIRVVFFNQLEKLWLDLVLDLCFWVL